MTPRLFLAGMSVCFSTGCATPAPGSGAARAAAVPLACQSLNAESQKAEPRRTCATRAAATTQPLEADATSQATPRPSCSRGGRDDASRRRAPVTATATVAPSVEPTAVPAPPTTLIEHFDAQLLALTKNAAAADDAFASLPADERELLTTVIDSLGRFRVALGNPQGLLADEGRAADRAWPTQLDAQTPLSLPTVALCRVGHAVRRVRADRPAALPRRAGDARHRLLRGRPLPLRPDQRRPLRDEAELRGGRSTATATTPSSVIAKKPATDRRPVPQPPP